MVKAVVLGAAGGIGQPLSLLLKSNPLVTELGLFDIVNTPGVAADLSHISTPSKVEGYLKPNDGLKKALTGADVVVIPAGVPRKPGMTRDDLFKINGGIVKELATGIATVAPKAFVLVISNPVNSTVPIVAEVFKKHNVYDPKRLFGVTTLDVVRASTFVSEILGDISLAPSVVVPVVGGHSGVTVRLYFLTDGYLTKSPRLQIVPLLSQSSHPLPANITDEEHAALVKRIQFGGDEVVKAKDGAGSATLSMAYAGAEFASKVIRAIKGEKGLSAPSFVSLSADAVGGAALAKELGEDLEFFSSTVELGPEGVVKISPLGTITEKEKALVKAAIPELVTNISTGSTFVAEAYKKEAEDGPARLLHTAFRGPYLVRNTQRISSMATTASGDHDSGMAHQGPAAAQQQPQTQSPMMDLPADLNASLQGLGSEQLLALLRNLPSIYKTDGNKEDAAQTLSNLSAQPPFAPGPHPYPPPPHPAGAIPGINDPGPSSHPRGPPNLGQLSAVAMSAAPAPTAAPRPEDADEGPASGEVKATASAPTSTRGRGGRSATMGSDEWTRQRKDNHASGFFPPVLQMSHHSVQKEVERRRRGNINDGINELGRIVPNGTGEKAKGAILSRAVQYIHHLKENEARNIEKWTLEKLLMDQAMGDLQTQLEEVKKLWEEERQARARAEAELDALRSAVAGAASNQTHARPEKRDAEPSDAEKDSKKQRVD
ncbi:hypothetical protein H0H93_007524 [Arthromyces matolae]|nr:hypothetical protein H0H93_007524 [Arthromyces matolae]